MSQTEPRNPFYLLLLISSLLFVATALAYGVVPILIENGAQAGQAPVPLPFSDALRAHGWKWLLWELLAMVAFACLSMGLDRLRTLKKQRTENTIPQSREIDPSR
jgi:uncharacterized BrkB/YihY/UPF0761 family membrane protein